MEVYTDKDVPTSPRHLYPYANWYRPSSKYILDFLIRSVLHIPYLAFIVSLYSSAMCLGVSASLEMTPPLSNGKNSTTEHMETVLNIGATTADPGVVGSGLTKGNLQKSYGSPQGERHDKIMSQGVGLVPDEQLLMERLMIGYHKYARPVVNASYMVTVKFGLTLVQISDMDEVNQVLTINVWLEQEWEDERLTWNPQDYNNLTTLRIPCEKLWLPDIVLYNSADDYTTGYMNSKAMVHYTGNVFWPPPAKFRSSCKIDITYFPFDDQTCELKFGSWTYDGFQVDITNRSDTVDLDNYVFSGEWELIGVHIRRQVIYYACCQEPYPDVRFTIVIRRKTLYYLFNIIFPCLWLTILSLLGFWLPPDSGEKITLGITVLLAFSVFMLLIAESMPATSEFVPLIGIYLTVTMGMTSLSIILTVFVLQLHHVGPHKRPVPEWLRALVCNVFARAVCMSRESHPFSRRHHHEQQLKRYHMGGSKVVGAHPMYGKERRPSPQPRVFVESCDNSTVTELYRANDGRADLQADAPPYVSYGVNVGDGNGGVSRPAAATGNNKILYANTTKSLSPGTEQTAIVPSAVRKTSDGNNAILKPPSQGGVNINSSRSKNCNGEAFPHQRDRIAPVNIAELGQTTLDISDSSRQGGLQCQEYTFHEPDSFALGYDQMGQGLSGRISRSPSFRSRSSSFRGDNYRASFRSAYPVLRDTGGGGPDDLITAGGGGAYHGGAYSDSSYDAYQQLVMEWQFIAHVMDRLLFWLFLFVALISSIAILVIKPMFKPPIE